MTITLDEFLETGWSLMIFVDGQPLFQSKDSDLDPIRNTPRYRTIIDGLRASQSKDR